jgi:hypothetical protein
MNRIIPMLLDQVNSQVMWQAHDQFPAGLLSAVTLLIEDQLRQDLDTVDIGLSFVLLYNKR